ncbi:beta-lactamase-like protein [Nemania abortiva]|nr:beta-lactamase-like protein [Nemania abortiva]
MTPVEIPPSKATVSVSIIDTGSWVYNIPYKTLFLPVLEGRDAFDLCSYAFLVTHHDANGKRRVLFDLGIRKDWEILVPVTIQLLKKWGCNLEIEKDVTDVLVEHGESLDDIEAIVWSHLHWDHTGNPSKFPSSVKIVVGPGITESHMPGWPQVATAAFNEADVAGHEIVEISEDQFTLEVGGMPAYDYFGDGSFYLLSAAGHALGHLNALARTSSSPESFILMAADSVHFGGEFRPSEAIPLPESVDVDGLHPQPCPRDVLLDLHPARSGTSAFFRPDPCFPLDLPKTEATIERIKAFDADDRVLVIFSHDIDIYNMLEFYPNVADDWLSKGWKLDARWTFLARIQRDAKMHRARHMP